MDVVTSVPAFFWSWIVPLSLQGLVLLAAAALADRLLPKSVWPELRLVAGTLLLLKLLLPPRLASPLPWTHPLATWADAGGPAWTGDSEALRRWALVAGWTWLAGVIVSLALLAGAALRLRRAWRSAEPAPPGIVAACRAAASRLGMTRIPPVRVARGVASPFVFGALRPRILLPPGIGAEDAEHALLHELAHVRRRDLVAAALVGLVRVLHWHHPLVHAAAVRLGDLREMCCDRSVARRLGAGATSYRRTLLGFAERRHREALAGLPMIGGSSLIARLRALDSLERDRPRLRRALTSIAALLVLALALPLAPAAERRAADVAELVTRPPGCLQLRYLVLRRLAEEQRRSSTPSEQP